jgi:hypothetical protein
MVATRTIIKARHIIYRDLHSGSIRSTWRSIHGNLYFLRRRHFAFIVRMRAFSPLFLEFGALGLQELISTAAVSSATDTVALARAERRGGMVVKSTAASGLMPFMKGPALLPFATITCGDSTRSRSRISSQTSGVGTLATSRMTQSCDWISPHVVIAGLSVACLKCVLGHHKSFEDSTLYAVREIIP